MRVNGLALFVAGVSTVALLNGFVPEYAFACLLVSIFIAFAGSIP